MSTSVETFAGSDGLVAAAGERLIDVVDAAIAARGRALVVLTGGGNGNRLMRFLATESARIDWTKVHLFWGDDRYVTEDDDERNEKQAREELLDHVDIHLLGVGPEGHINSLFPDTPAVREKTRMVVDVEDSPKPPPLRITLTLPAIQRSREVWLLVSGAEKAEAVAAAVGGASPVSIPAAGAIGREHTVWFLDTGAASELPS